MFKPVTQGRVVSSIFMLYPLPVARKIDVERITGSSFTVTSGALVS